MAVYLVEAQFMLDASKYFGALINASCAMLNLGIPHINVVSKMDLIADQTRENGDEAEDIAEESHPLHSFFYPDLMAIQEKLHYTHSNQRKLTEALTRLLEDLDIVSFVPLNIKKEQSVIDLLSHIDHAVQFGEQVNQRT